jgi:uncharacterized membrane protein YfcA
MINVGLLLAGYGVWGAIVGLVVGFTAIGKGLLGTPGLIVIFGMEAVPAVGTMAVAGAVMMAAGTYTHYRAGNVQLKIALLFSATSMPASYIAARMARSINNIIPLQTVIGVIIIVSVVVLFYRYVIVRPAPRELHVTPGHLIVSPILGAVLGVLMGATSISGSLIAIVFILLLKLPSPQAIGTTSMVSMASLAVASLAHLQANNVDWLVLGGLVPGVMAGSYIGAKYVNRVPRQALRLGILVILVAAAVMLFLEK